MSQTTVKKQTTNTMPPINVLRPIYDFKTKNKSFIETHLQLKMLGVRNNAFHLLLLNPLLQGIDPYDENLTPTEVMMIIQECKLNMYYYLREVVRIEETGGKLVRFRMDRGTLAASYNFANNINFYLMKPRQTGKTVGINAMLSWAFKFNATNSDFMFCANEESVTKKNLKGMRAILRNLPPYMVKMGTEVTDALGKTIRKTDNIKKYHEPAQNNNAMVAKCAASEDAAETIGRGFTQAYQFFDESEFTKFIDIIVKVSGMSFNTASRNAAKNHSGYCRVFATTPGNLSDQKACQSALTIVKDALPWEERFYDEDIRKYKMMIKSKSVFKIVYIEYDYKQLGLGEDWFLDAVSNVGGDSDKVRREILLQRFAGNNKSPFTVDEIAELDEEQKKPIAIKKLNRIYEILFYEKPKKDRLYFFGIDPSDGTGSDNYAITVLDPYELTVVAEFRSPYMTIDGCVDLVRWMVKNYFNNPLLIIERNRNGGAVVERFKSSELRDRVYFSPEANNDNARFKDELDDNGFIKEQYVRNKYFGSNTTTSTRKVMMNILVDMVHFSRHLVCSRYIVDDIKNLIVKTGKIQAAPSKHDDSVMSWLIALYILYYGKQLERWGFKRGEIPNDVEESDEFKELAKLYRNPEIRRQFPTMYTYYKDEMEKRNRIREIERYKSLQEHDEMEDRYKIGGISMNTTVEFDPNIDDEPVSDDPFNSSRIENNARESIVRQFMSLNKM